MAPDISNNMSSRLGSSNGTKNDLISLDGYTRHARLGFLDSLLEDRDRARSSEARQVIVADGDSLQLIDVVSIARRGVKAERSKAQSVTRRVEESIETLSRHLQEGHSVYGVTTGFGGSADTRTTHLETLQKALVQHHVSAVLLPSDVGRLSGSLTTLKSHALPRDVVKGAMLARCNTLLRGHSAVSLKVIDNILSLLNHDMTPIIPLRGSISASGDLTPLAYVAATVQGNPDVYVQCGPERGDKILPADEALRTLNLEPVVLGPKEGLGLLNGTAISCSAGALALHDAEHLALLTQLMTAMATEALRGSAGNFHAFLSQSRPHAGQAEAAALMWQSLDNSQLATKRAKEGSGLKQDRYALRTAPQWIGPQLEDLVLARRQMTTELNSTTDNPLVDVDGDIVHHGGNFQAVSVTSAMEKTRLSLQMLGKLMFSQLSEILNPMTNGILPPNLCFDDPSLSYALKGVDINMASYMSELAYLANPVSSHVQSAEMHNQAVNSLALITTRYTMDAVELVSLMAATHLYGLCQAVDLQVLHSHWVALLRPALSALSEEHLAANGDEASSELLFTQLMSSWTRNKALDLHDRCAKSVEEVSGLLLQRALAAQGADDAKSLEGIRCWCNAARMLLQHTYTQAREAFATDETTLTEASLATSSAELYRFVRHELQVPLHRGIVDFPSSEEQSPREKKNIGSHIATIYASLRDGRLQRAILANMSSIV